MTDKRSFTVFCAVTTVHFLLLAFLVAAPGAIEPPVGRQDMQGVLVSVQSPESVTTPRNKAAVPPVPKPAPQPVVPLIPVKAPPSERAITIPHAEPVPVTQSDAKPLQAAEQNSKPAPPQEPSAGKASRIDADASGGALVMPRVDAGHLKNPAPVYPAISRRLGEQGQVLLDVLILADGTVGEIKIKTTSRHSRLDNAALDTVKRWRYQPARRGNTPIAFWYVQPIIFSLTT